MIFFNFHKVCFFKLGLLFFCVAAFHTATAQKNGNLPQTFNTPENIARMVADNDRQSDEDRQQSYENDCEPARKKILHFDPDRMDTRRQLIEKMKTAEKNSISHLLFKRPTTTRRIVSKRYTINYVYDKPLSTAHIFTDRCTDTYFTRDFEKAGKPLFALKTNLLYDTGSAVNMEVEAPVGQRWSIAGELTLPWWKSDEKQRCLQLMNGMLEVRRWFGERFDRPALTGWFAGIYAGGGYYDVEWGTKGYQGKHFMTGVSGGYTHTISKNECFRMEYSLGAGYLTSPYNSYTPVFGYGIDDKWHLIRRQSGTFNWVGPARIKISLVWMLHNNTNRKRR
jgi:hypothetical protein